MPISDFLEKLASLLKEAAEKNAAKASRVPLLSRMDFVTTREELDKVLQSDDYKAFVAQVTCRVRELQALFEANIEKYDCSFVIGFTSINSMVADGCSIAATGRRSSIVESCRTILYDSDLQWPLSMAKIMGSK